MTNSSRHKIDVVIPLYNESAGLISFHSELTKELSKITDYDFEIIYCDDGSTDNTSELVKNLSHDKFKIKLIKLTRNFGKEMALTAGIAAATGVAIVILDGDGQHPPELIYDFIKSWENGSKVVVGIRSNNESKGIVKKLGSWSFYKIFNLVTGQKLTIGSTDFRLIDKAVQREFLKLKESNRITRALIDWLGFKKEYIYFQAKAREFGEPGYSTQKLFKLAIDSFVSITPRPLYIFGYAGVFITLISFITGILVIIEQLILGDPWHWRFTGTAMLGILITFLIGIVLISQGILSLYISLLHNQTKQRPLYVIDYLGSLGIRED